MRKFFFLFVAAGLSLTSCVSNPEGDKAETTEAQQAPAETTGAAFTVNPQESTLSWEGKKVSATHHGTISIKSGNLVMDGDKLSGGEFIVDMNSIVNEDQQGEWKEKLVGHLKSEDFFHVEKHPEAIFQITEVKATDNPNQVVVSGNLTIKGISKNITFNADVVENSANKVQMKADFNIEREQWGITYTGMADDLISKEINFKVNIVANS